MNRFHTPQRLLVALLACGCLVAPALAEDPVKADGDAPNARSLGLAEAMLDYCAKADPSSTTQIQQRIKQLTQGASDLVLGKVRNSDEYKRARDAEHDFVDKVDPHNAKHMCSRTIAANK